MNALSRSSLALSVAVGLSLIAGIPSASAETFNITYFEAPTGSADFYNGTSSSGSPNFVLPTLGPDGLPVYNPSYTTSFGLLLPPSSTYLNSSNELLYWTPASSSLANPGSMISPDGSGTISLSSTPVTMFAPGTGGSDASFQETAILTDTFSVASGTTDNMTFTVDADDNAFVYVFPTGAPGTLSSLVDSVGGIHTDGGPVTSSSISYGPGSYTIEIFYADHDVTQSGLAFSDTQSILTSPVAAAPEPDGFVLLGTGLLGAAALLRRRLVH